MFNRSLHEFLTTACDPKHINSTSEEIKATDEVLGGMGLTQSEHDPCYYYKVYADGTRFDLGFYVDDGWCCDSGGAHADRDIALLDRKFGITIDKQPKHFLNMNIEVVSATKIKLTSEAYITRMADKYVPDWRTRAKVLMPSIKLVGAPWVS